MNTIKTYLEKNKGVATIIAAKELGVPEKDVIDTLTEGVTPVSIDNFDEIMNEVSTWGGDMTIIVTNNSVIFEVKGSLPQGSYARGFFNLHGSGGHIGGHLMSEKFTKYTLSTDHSWGGKRAFLFRYMTTLVMQQLSYIWAETTRAKSKPTRNKNIRNYNRGMKNESNYFHDNILFVIHLCFC